MNLKDIKPACQLVQRYGVKSICYAPAGMGKTPISETAPRPLLAACEPGLLSMRRSNIPAIELYTVEAIDDFFKWLFNSKEADNFDTICIDSISQMAEIYLDSVRSKSRDGRKHYMLMSQAVMANLSPLYFMQKKHCYLICKEIIVEENDTYRAKPYFPGKELYVKVPHLFDEIFRLEQYTMPDGKLVPVFRTRNTPEVYARDRSGQLADLEAANLTYVFNKCMGIQQ